MTSYRKLQQEVDSLQQNISKRQQPPEPPPEPARPAISYPRIPLSPRVLPVAFVAGIVFERLSYISARSAARNPDGEPSRPGRAMESFFAQLLPVAEVFLRAYLDSPPPERREPRR